MHCVLASSTVASPLHVHRLCQEPDWSSKLQKQLPEGDRSRCLLIFCRLKASTCHKGSAEGGGEGGWRGCPHGGR